VKYNIFVIGCALFVPGLAFATNTASQPYRPVNEIRQWTIEGQTYGLLKVRIMINGQLVADGSMKDANFSSTYGDREIRVTCNVGRMRFSTGSDQTCSVYVGEELAANLVFVRN
jgi:hypothetical protein